jgi:hypothetical protein
VKVSLLESWGVSVPVVVLGCPNVLALSTTNLNDKWVILSSKFGEVKARNVLERSPVLIAYKIDRVEGRLEELDRVGRMEAITYCISKTEEGFKRFLEREIERGGGGGEE